MIAQLKGILTVKAKEGIILDVNGVGYELAVSQTALVRLPEVGKSVTLLVHTHVTEGSFSLYGFFDSLEKTLFKKLISVSGIGPKIALQILSGLTPIDLIRAVTNENLVTLTQVNGVGKKTAERMIVELKDKFIDLITDLPSMEILRGDHKPSIAEKTYHDALSALINLGYNRLSAEKALTNIAIHPESTVEEVLRGSLGVLSR